MAFRSPRLKSSRSAFWRLSTQRKVGFRHLKLNQDSMHRPNKHSETVRLIYARPIEIKVRAQSFPQFWTIPRLHFFYCHGWKYQERHVSLQIFSKLPFYQYQRLHHTNTEMEGQIVCKLQLEYRNLYQGFCTGILRISLNKVINIVKFERPMHYQVHP